MKNGSDSNSMLSRRRILQLGVTGTAAGLIAGALPLTLPTPAEAQDVSTPDAALAELMSGNKRYNVEHSHLTAARPRPFEGQYGGKADAVCRGVCPVRIR